MHTGPVPGEFTGKETPLPDAECRKCGKKGGVVEHEWDSSDGAYTDWRYECSLCGGSWWVEGIDS